MTSGGAAAAAATEAAISLSWRPGPSKALEPAGARRSSRSSAVLLRTCQGLRVATATFCGPEAEAALLGFDALISCLRRLSLPPVVCLSSLVCLSSSVHPSFSSSLLSVVFCNDETGTDSPKGTLACSGPAAGLPGRWKQAAGVGVGAD